VLATGGGGIGVKNLGFAAIPIASNKSSSTVVLGEIAGSFVDVLSDFIELELLLLLESVALGVIPAALSRGVLLDSGVAPTFIGVIRNSLPFNTLELILEPALLTL
jgi:hypothetical protein